MTQRGTGQGGPGPSAPQPGVRHQGAGARDLWSRQGSSLLSASICPSLFSWTLALARVTRHPSPPEVASGQAPPITLSVLLPVWEGLAHASPPPPCHLKGSSAGAASCSRGEHRTPVPQVVCGHRVPEENQPPVPGTPPPGLLGFQGNKQIRTSPSLGFPICKMGGGSWIAVTPVL